MAAINSNSPNQEEFQTPPSKITHSRTNDEPIPAIPISFSLPDHYHIEYYDRAEKPTNKGKEKLEVSTDETMTETPSASQNSSSKRGRIPKPPPEWIGNWDVDCKKRPHSNRFDKIYRHKEKGFRCRSLLECERYEKHGIRPQTRKVKTQEKEESNSNKSRNETNEIILANQNNEADEEAIIAQRRQEAENMREIVEEFLAEAHYNQLHMFKP